MIVSACSSRWLSRAFSRSSSATRRASGDGGTAGRPRFLGVSAARLPCSRCRRQVVRCDEYNPSRRSSAPNSPVPAQASACRRTPSLYSAVNRRRAARSATSGSGVEIGGTTCSTVGLLLIGLRLAVSAFPSLRAAIGDRGRLAFFARAMGKTPLSALYSNSREGPCLTIVGTEGGPPKRCFRVNPEPLCKSSCEPSWSRG